jgi:hypothetical protein
MRIRKLLLTSALAVTASLSAQTVPATTVCLSKIEGPESTNWNLRPAVIHELAREFTEQRRQVSVVALDANNDKRAAAEASEKHCDFVVYSIIERLAGDVNSQMNASITKRGLANPDATTGASVLRYSFTIKNIDRKKVGDGKAQVELMPTFGPKDFELRGRAIVSDVVDKMIAALPKQ